MNARQKRIEAAMQRYIDAQVKQKEGKRGRQRHVAPVRVEKRRIIQKGGN